MKLSLRAAFALFSLALAVPAVRAEDWAACLASALRVPLDFSESVRWGYAQSDGKGAWETMEARSKTEALPSGGWKLEFELPGGSQRVEVDASLRFVSEAQRVVDPALVERYGVDAFDWKASGSEAAGTYYLKGKVKQTQKASLGKDTLMTQALDWQARSILASGRSGSFPASVVMGGRKVDATILLSRAEDPLAAVPGYRYPEAMRAALPPSGGPGAYWLLDLRLRGVYAAFYPHHMYMVFSDAPAKPKLADWGGKPSEANFLWRAR